MKNLFRRYEEISKMFNDEKEESEVLTYNFDRKILDNKDNEEVLNTLLTKEDGEVFMLAGTGTGKTFSLIKTIQEMSNEVIYIFAVPNRSQVLQLNSEHNVFGLYGGKTIKKDFKDNLIVSVYDKVDEAIEFCKEHKKEYKLIIDEAHQLNLARYRSKALKNLFKAIEEAKTTIYLTATPNALMYLNVSKIYNFVSNEDNALYKEVKLLEFDKNLKTALKTIILNKYKERIKLLIRYNDIDSTKELINDLKKLGLKCLLINSNEKESTFDGTNIIYTNELTNEIINFSNLPDADVYFTTSILDAGINIVTLNGSNDLSNLECLFIIKDSKDLLLDNLLQFAARPRMPFKCFNVLKRTNDVVENTISLERNIEYYTNKVKDEIEYIKANINLLMLKHKNNKEEVLRELSYQLNYKDLDNVTNDLNGSIVIDEDLNVSIDKRNLFYFCYIRANEQLYYNNKNLMDCICEKYTIEQVDNKKVKIDSNYKEEVASVLVSSLEDESKLKEIKGTEEYKNYNCLIELGFEKEEATNILVNKSKADFVTIKNDKVIEKMKTLNDQDIRELNDVLDGKIQKINLSIRLVDLASSEAFDMIKSLNKKGLDIRYIINKVNTFEELESLNNNYQYIKTNIKYLNKEKLTLNSERQQLEVIKFFEQWNIKRQKITTKKVEDLTTIINNKFNKTYSTKKILEFVNKIFIIDGDDMKGLRIKF